MTKEVKTEIKDIKLSSIEVGGGTQMREQLDQDKIDEYAELTPALGAEPVLPPIDVWHDGVKYWLGDGFHRYFAASKVMGSDATIRCVVHTGTQRDALAYALGANAEHGLPRSQADKRKAVMTALSDSEWVQWSDREIGKLCKVHHNTVAACRKDMGDEANPSTRRYTDKHGNEQVMDTSAIGSNHGGGKAGSGDSSSEDKPNGKPTDLPTHDKMGCPIRGQKIAEAFAGEKRVVSAADDIKALRSRIAALKPDPAFAAVDMAMVLDSLKKLEQHVGASAAWSILPPGMKTPSGKPNFLTRPQWSSLSEEQRAALKELADKDKEKRKAEAEAAKAKAKAEKAKSAAKSGKKGNKKG